MPRTTYGLATALLVAAVASGGAPAQADPITGWIIAGSVANTLIKGPFYSGRADIGPRYGYPIYGYPGYLRPGYTYVGYDGPGAWGPPPAATAPVPPTCYWTNKPTPNGLRRIRICY